MATFPRLLIVENDITTQKLLRLIGTIEHYEVETARTAAEALQVFDRFDPKVVLLDLRLADGSSGLDVLEDLKARARPPVIIVLSQYAEAEARVLDGAVSESYQKPFDTRGLSRALARHQHGGDE